jgi:hypothetical protein
MQQIIEVVIPNLKEVIQKQSCGNVVVSQFSSKVIFRQEMEFHSTGPFFPG